MEMVGVHQADRRGRAVSGTPSRRLLQSGTMHVVHDDGTEQEIGPGQTYVIEPGHDAWVVGDEAIVGVRVPVPDC